MKVGTDRVRNFPLAVREPHSHVAASVGLMSELACMFVREPRLPYKEGSPQPSERWSQFVAAPLSCWPRAHYDWASTKSSTRG